MKDIEPRDCITPTLTIALPAYNEERTIADVLHALLKQHRDTFILDRIVVYSDGSTDSTASIVRQVQEHAPGVRLMDDSVRRGKIYRMNQMFRDCTSDLLMILDADIGLSGNDFLNSFVAAARSDQASVMFAAHQIPLRPDGFRAGIYYAAYLLWDYIRLSVPEKDHVQNFYGAATIFKKQFLAAAHMPDEFMEERTYLYLMAKRMGGFKYVSDAVIFYWPPHTAADFATLRNRAFGSDRTALEKVFGRNAENAEIIPREYKISGVVRFFLDHPIYALPAIFLNLRVSKETRAVQRSAHSTRIWEIVSSTKKPMEKVRLVLSSYDCLKNPVYAGGGAVAIHEVAKRLAKSFDVTVLTGNYPGARDEMVDGVAYVRIGLQFFPGRLGQLLYHLLLPWQVLTRRHDAWIESFTPPYSTSFTPLFTKKPVVGLAHMLSGKDMGRKYHLPFQYIENIGLRQYRHFIVLSEQAAQEIHMQNPLADIAVIGNGVRQPRVPNSPGSGEYLAYLGRIEIGQKGLDLLLAAYAQIREEVAVPLRIAGSGPRKEIVRLEKLIDSYGLHGSVTLVGRIEEEGKDEFLRGALAGVIPSRYEESSLVMLEMMSYGVPVVAFDIPGTRWAPENAIVRVPPFDANALARAILKLIRDRALRKTVSGVARAYARTRDWDTVSKKYERDIAHMLAEHKRT